MYEKLMIFFIICLIISVSIMFYFKNKLKTDVKYINKYNFFKYLSIGLLVCLLVVSFQYFIKNKNQLYLKRDENMINIKENNTDDFNDFNDFNDFDDFNDFNEKIITGEQFNKKFKNHVFFITLDKNLNFYQPLNIKLNENNQNENNQIIFQFYDIKKAIYSYGDFFYIIEIPNNAILCDEITFNNFSDKNIANNLKENNFIENSHSFKFDIRAYTNKFKIISKKLNQQDFANFIFNVTMNFENINCNFYTIKMFDEYNKKYGIDECYKISPFHTKILLKCYSYNFNTEESEIILLLSKPFNRNAMMENNRELYNKYIKYI